MRLAGGCSALAGAAVVLLLAGCASDAGGKASAVSHGGPTASAVPVPSSLTVIRPSASASTTAAASAPAASAVAQAKVDQAKFPKAKLYAPSARPGTVSVAYAGESGSARYVDAYTVVFLCGPGVPDDCLRYVGAPEYRIPLASDARLIVLDATMKPDRPVDFAGFRTVAQGPDGTYAGNYDLFDVTYTAGGQAASLTMEYTP